MFPITEIVKILVSELESTTKRLSSVNPFAFPAAILAIVSLICSGYLINRFFGSDVLAVVVGILTGSLSVLAMSQAGKQTSKLIRDMARDNLAVTRNESLVTAEHFYTEVASLKAQIVQLSALSGEQLKNSREQLIKALLEEIGTNGVQKLTEDYQKKDYLRTQQNNIQMTRERLLKETQLLWSFANRNMTIGSIFSVLGMIALFYFLLSAPVIGLAGNDAANSFAQFSVHFLPRVTFVIFIEIFAFFFLRLYRSAIAEVKYFQNELTNVELRNISLVAASQTSDTALLKIVVEQLSATEKNNIILKAGETTIDLMKEERSSLSDRTLTSELKQVIESLRSRGKNSE